MQLPTEKSQICTDLSKYIFQFYGDPKVGKSTLASKFPNAFFLSTEPGHKFLEVYGGDHVHNSWDDIRDTTTKLVMEKHKFETVVVDIVDNAWDMCRGYVYKKLNIQHESEDPGYGRSWDMVTSEFVNVLRGVANTGMGVVFISHSELGSRTTKGVERAYMDNTLKKRPRKFINGISDFILYCYSDNNGKRLMLTKGNENVNAGDRSGILPEVMPMKNGYDILKKTLEENVWKTH